MRIEFVSIQKFRNLKNFEIEFSSLKTVLIGQNAAGKSNFLEALVLIFKHLDLGSTKAKPDQIFEYEIIYSIGGGTKEKVVKIKHSKDKKSNKFKHLFWLGTGEKDLLGGRVYKTSRTLNKDLLPKYIFAYYSGLGNSNRLEEHFEEYKDRFAVMAKDVTDNNVPDPPRMLYADLIHSQFSLFSFFIDENKDTQEFLKNNLGIEDLASVLLTIQKPDWSTDARMEKLNEYKFFGSSGVVKNLLYHLHDKVAFAPLRSKIYPTIKLWEKKKGKQKGIETVHLYIDDFKKINEFVVENQWTSFQFFHVLNTANVSRLITKEGIQIRVKKVDTDRILFRDLSEGEQQLLTVLGLMRFTYTDEALFLLDEPDTHLNPLWRWRYMNFIDQIVLNKTHKSKDFSPSVQVIMTSHDPLTIGGLTREEVRIFHRKENLDVEATKPMEDPKGLGVAGILTSDIFGLPSTLPPDIYSKIERRKDLERELTLKKSVDKHRNEEINDELSLLNSELDNLGYYRITSDPLYEKFQKAILKRPEFKKVENRRLTPEEIQRQYEIAEQILEKILKEQDAKI